MQCNITRATGFLLLAAMLTACRSPDRVCVSGQMRPHPIYVAPEAFCALGEEIACLNHRFAPYEVAMDRCVLPKKICNRLIAIDNDLQNLNAAMISREIAPEKMARQLERLEADLSKVEAQLCVVMPPDACCKSPRTMAASLNTQLAAVRRQHRMKLPLAKTPNAVGNKLDANANEH
ncbi:MAG: hypothetical protein NTZ46_09065 [Verrucomicrobia bacterium]|nr:hypothetical protein [Verrucomicrobiota bacterium]